MTLVPSGSVVLGPLHGKYSSDLHHHCDIVTDHETTIWISDADGRNLVLVGCHTTQPPVTKELIAGNYTFVSEDLESRATDHSLDHLVLQSDGIYELVAGGTAKAIS